jgi:ferredoxin-NADP reductase
MHKIDDFLNNITIYRLVVYGLIGLLGAAAIMAFTGVLQVSRTGILLVTTVSVVTSYLINRLGSWLYKAPTNSESYLITALILSLILPPTISATQLGYVALANAVAVISKFVLVHKRKHIFNPAAFGAVVVSLMGVLSVTWWVGTPFLLPFVTVFGLLVIRKIHRFKLVIVFGIASFLMILLVGLSGPFETFQLIKNTVLSGPIIFFATIMLSEPATMPARHYYQLLYGLLVGALYTSGLHAGIISSSPHMVLLIGNIFAVFVTPIVREQLHLKEKIRISSRVYDYVFTPERPFVYEPGQYMEWTLPHEHIDSRGNRRSFTLASSPTEPEIHMGVKFYEQSSSFKKALKAMQPGDTIAVGQLAGNFVLPKDVNRKLVFIAGGVGITPFRSMVKYLIDTDQSRDITLFYIVGSQEEVAYKDILVAARHRGIKVVVVVGKRLNSDELSRYIPEVSERSFYVSGPNGFVESVRKSLTRNGVRPIHIVSDYFSGY